MTPIDVADYCIEQEKAAWALAWRTAVLTRVEHRKFPKKVEACWGEQPSKAASAAGMIETLKAFSAAHAKSPAGRKRK
jgi:hypothetical protein